MKHDTKSTYLNINFDRYTMVFNSRVVPVSMSRLPIFSGASIVSISYFIIPYREPLTTADSTANVTTANVSTADVTTADVTTADVLVLGYGL